MTDKNPFDLASRKVSGEKLPYEKNILSEEEKKKILDNMVEIKREYWKHLPLNARIAYVKKDGEFSRGGFVSEKPWINKSEEWSIKITSRFIKKNEKNDKFEWVVNFSSLAKIYKEINNFVVIETLMIRDATEALQNELRQVKTLLTEHHELKKRAEKRKSVEVRLKPSYK